jgi:glycosyl transferase family 22 (putative mannosyltransferase)
MTRMRLVAAGLALDVLVLLGGAVAMLAIAGHGQHLHVGRFILDTSSVHGVAAVLLMILGLRAAVPEAPVWFLIPVSSWSVGALELWRRARTWLIRLTPRSALGVVLPVLLGSLALKLSIAYRHPGFWTGDDVEIHEMTLSRLFGWHLPVWDLRSPFYPMGFVFPAQWLAAHAGVVATQSLVFVGRSVVAAFSVVTLWLTFVIARRLFDSVPVAVLSTIVLASNKLHTMGGSSELPRTVASCFVLASFGLLSLSRRNVSALCAGALIGIAAALRFSEEIFLIPALLQLATARRWGHAGLACCGFVLVAVLVLGPVDQMYWGEKFFSLRHAAEFTLVRGQSSRGVQPFFEYIAAIPAWADLFVVALAASALRLRLWTLAAWTWLPVVFLSALPHKEPRYLIPILPYLSMLAAASLWAVAGWLVEVVDSRRSRAAPFLLAACAASLIGEAGGFVIGHSDGAVALAQEIARRDPFQGIAIEQAWRLGGHLYLPAAAPFIDLDSHQVEDRAALEDVLRGPRVVRLVLDARHLARTHLDVAVLARGFREVSPPVSDSESGYRFFER